MMVANMEVVKFGQPTVNETVNKIAGDSKDNHQCLVRLSRLTNRPEVEALNPLIESRQKQLRAAALKLGSRIYAKAPAVICRRLEKDWSLWRRK
jgi:hypothetical protein